MNSLPTAVYTSAHRPPVETHVYCILDHLVDWLLSAESPDRSIPLITNHYCRPLTAGPYIFYNTEQLTRPEILAQVYNRVISGDVVEVWDYSAVNVQILQSRGIAVRHVPMAITQQTATALRSLYQTTPKDFDIAFCGVASPRRMAILQQIASQGYKLLLVTTVYGPERDTMIARCRVQLNLHQTEQHQVFESVRCEPWLQAGQPILTEPSLDNDSRCKMVTAETLLQDLAALLRPNPEDSTPNRNARPDFFISV